jgi:hypothetical protein
VIGGIHRSGMIATVTLRLLYLFFQQVLGQILLLGRTTSTKDLELLVLRHEVAVLRRTDPTPTSELGRPAVFASLIRHLPTRLRGHRLVTPGHDPALAPSPRGRRWTYPNQPGRPPIDATIATLVGRMPTASAAEQCSCGISRTADSRRAVGRPRAFSSCGPRPSSRRRQPGRPRGLRPGRVERLGLRHHPGRILHSVACHRPRAPRQSRGRRPREFTAILKSECRDREKCP